eukprot:gene3961-5680_t
MSALFSILTHKAYKMYSTIPLLHGIGRLFADNKLPKGLEKLPNYEKVSDRVFRILGLNPGSHTLQGTNAWLVTGLNTNDHVLIDTGEDITAKIFVKMLFDEVFPLSKTKSLSKILLTHGHGDHQGGVSLILSELTRRNMLPLPVIYKRNIIPNGHFPAIGFHAQHLDDNQIFFVDEFTTIQSIYTPGHTDDSVCFLLKEDNALFTGDSILGCGTTVFDDFSQYMSSLRVMYPGHGPIISNALSKVTEYIDHRLQRENQILSVLSVKGIESTICLPCEPSNNNQSQELITHTFPWTSSWDLVQEVYGNLPFFVKVSAHRNLTLHLQKLHDDGKVESSWPDQWRLKISKISNKKNV